VLVSIPWRRDDVAMATSHDTLWHDLARRCGIEPVFVDALGTRREASLDTLRQALEVFGVECRARTDVAREIARLGVAPRSAFGGARKCHLPRGKYRGVYANLYTVVPAEDRGFGDFKALEGLIDFAAAQGLDYVAINPLHAIRERQEDASPYYPVSRRFRSPLYLDPQRLVDECGAPVSVWRDFCAGAQRIASGDFIDYAQVSRLRGPLLRDCFAAFKRVHEARDTTRAQRFRKYLRDQGDALRRFALYRAIDTKQTARGRAGAASWPANLRDVESETVAEFAAKHRDEIAFHSWLQFELSEQWAALGKRCRANGLRLGLYTDLAIGAAPDSADAWSHPRDFVSGFALGAPPDGYARTGQVWHLPPLDPRRFGAEDGPYAAIVRSAMEGAGAVRIDHAIGLVRQYWVPNGADGTAGVMVRMPSKTIFEMIARASRRARCAVVAEDLGTVPRELPGLLARYAMLSSRVMLFSRDRRGAFEDPRDYPLRSAASVNTHDLPPLAGWIDGVELPIHRGLGLIGSASALRAAKAARKKDVVALAAMLRRTRFAASHTRGVAAMVDAANRAVVGARSRFATVALDDLALETKPVNVPTATFDRYPVWARRMRTELPSIKGRGSRSRPSPRS
jgi:4-alpha-glucanotransferase